MLNTLDFLFMSMRNVSHIKLWLSNVCEFWVLLDPHTSQSEYVIVSFEFRWILTYVWMWCFWIFHFSSVSQNELRLLSILANTQRGELHSYSQSTERKLFFRHPHKEYYVTRELSVCVLFSFKSTRSHKQTNQKEKKTKHKILSSMQLCFIIPILLFFFLSTNIL